MKHNFHFWVNYPLTIPLMTDADMCLTSSKSKEQDRIALLHCIMNEVNFSLG